MPKDNGKQNSNKFYTNKYKKNIAGSYGCKIVCIDDMFGKIFKTY